MKRDYTIEFWRFVFCIVILFLHLFSKVSDYVYPLCKAGYLGVEFFFLLSGYGIFGFYIKRIEGKSFLQRFSQLGFYIGNRLVRLYPLYLLSLVVMLIERAIINRMSFGQIYEYLKSGWAEFLMLQCGPLGNEVLISANWYVAALFWGSVILLCILIAFGKAGGYFICPIISVGIYQYYFYLIRKIDVIFSYHAVLRSLAGLSLGIFIGFWVRLLKEKGIGAWFENSNAGRKCRVVLYTCANLILAGIVIYTNFGHRSGWDFVVISLFAVCIFVLLLLAFPLPEKMIKVCKKLVKTTYPIYLFQMPVIEGLLYLFLT